MFFFQSWARRCASILIAGVLASTGNSARGAEDIVGVTEITPRLLVFATSGGNVVASVGPDGAFLVGTPSAESTPRISSILASRIRSAVRYVVIGPQNLDRSEGDAGWGQRGAFVAMQENALDRLGGHKMGAAQPLPPRLIELGVDRPRVAFSEVLTFDLNGEAIHVVHQRPAYSNADTIVHFHAANLVYFGNVFPGDSYPEIGREQGGSLDGVLKILSPWTNNAVRVVPARGKVMSGAEVKAFCDMIVTVQGRVQHIVDAGRTENEVLEQHPTAEFDGRWGHGRVSPEAFVHTIYSFDKPAR